MNGKDKLREYIKLVETYNNLITFPTGMLLMKNMAANDPYLSYRMSMQLANEDVELVDTKARENAVLIFFSQQSLDIAKKLFDRDGEPYEDLTPMKSKEEPGVNTVSPVASDRFAKKKKSII